MDKELYNVAQYKVYKMTFNEKKELKINEMNALVNRNSYGKP